jgi:hypothetical protein
VTSGDVQIASLMTALTKEELERQDAEDGGHRADEPQVSAILRFTTANWNVPQPVTITGAKKKPAGEGAEDPDGDPNSESTSLKVEIVGLRAGIAKLPVKVTSAPIRP